LDEIELVSKRVFLTLPDSVHDKLERWANYQGRPIANLAAYIVEKVVEEAEAEGKIPPPPTKDPPAEKG
jgi:predicted DNA-binding protein